MSKYQYGGIYCCIPLGYLYDESLVSSVRWRLRKTLGVTIKGLTNEQLNKLIRETLVKWIRGLMSGSKIPNYASLTKAADRREERLIAKQNALVNQGKNDADINTQINKSIERYGELRSIIEEVNNSIGFGIYHNNLLLSNSVGTPAAHNEYARLGNIRDFLLHNKSKLPIDPKGWTVVLVVAHYAAARFEAKGAYPDSRYKGFNKRVLYAMVWNIANALREMTGRKHSGNLRYGYILSRTGYEGQIFNVI